MSDTRFAILFIDSVFNTTEVSTNYKIIPRVGDQLGHVGRIPLPTVKAVILHPAQELLSRHVLKGPVPLVDAIVVMN